MGTQKRRVVRISYYYRIVKNEKIDYIKISDAKNNTIKNFIYDKRIRHIRNFHTQRRANEEAILNYFKSKSKRKYMPTTEKQKQKYNESMKKLHKHKPYQKRVKTFKNENRLIFTNKGKVKNYNYVYIRAEVMVYLDGVKTKAYGRSKYYYSSEYIGGIPKSEIKEAIATAIIRAIAPFGSNVKFKPLRWDFVYHQEKFVHFGRRLKTSNPL